MERFAGLAGLIHVSIGVHVEDATDPLWFWNPEDSGDLILNPEITTLEELAVLVGIFTSKGQARKNGMFGPIPWGIHLLGTKKQKV